MAAPPGRPRLARPSRSSSRRTAAGHLDARADRHARRSRQVPRVRGLSRRNRQPVAEMSRRRSSEKRRRRLDARCSRCGGGRTRPRNRELGRCRWRMAVPRAAAAASLPGADVGAWSAAPPVAPDRRPTSSASAPRPASTITRTARHRGASTCRASTSPSCRWPLHPRGRQRARRLLAARRRAAATAAASPASATYALGGARRNGGRASRLPAVATAPALDGRLGRRPHAPDGGRSKPSRPAALASPSGASRETLAARARADRATAYSTHRVGEGALGPQPLGGAAAAAAAAGARAGATGCCATAAGRRAGSARSAFSAASRASRRRSSASSRRASSSSSASRPPTQARRSVRGRRRLVAPSSSSALGSSSTRDALGGRRCTRPAATRSSAPGPRRPSRRPGGRREARPARREARRRLRRPAAVPRGRAPRRPLRDFARSGRHVRCRAGRRRRDAYYTVRVDGQGARSSRPITPLMAAAAGRFPHAACRPGAGRRAAAAFGK